MREWNVIVGNVVEEMDLRLIQQQTGGNRVHGRIPPSLVEESAILVERVEIVNIGI